MYEIVRINSHIYSVKKTVLNCLSHSCHLSVCNVTARIFCLQLESLVLLLKCSSPLCPVTEKEDDLEREKHTHTSYPTRGISRFRKGVCLSFGRSGRLGSGTRAKVVASSQHVRGRTCLRDGCGPRQKNIMSTIYAYLDLIHTSIGTRQQMFTMILN